MVRRTSAKLLRYLVPESLFGTQRTRQIVKGSTAVSAVRNDAEKVFITIYDYDAATLEEHEVQVTEECFRFKDNDRITWINVDGINRNIVNKIGTYYGIHPLLMEDIASMNQRPKMDEVEGILYCLLNMLYFNPKEGAVEHEQISIVLGKDTVITFQEDASRDVFDPIREKLRMANSRLRQRGADYLCYSMLDIIVDNYFIVMEKLGERIELLEEEVIRCSDKLTLAKITHLRKELIVLKRNLVPVRDLIGSIMRSENELLEEGTLKYFKDVHDHIIQAHDLSENYRDVMVSMQDLYINNVNLRMNEVMKVMAIVTCLLAPATVIGGIFGMNFDVIPTLHNQWGFYSAVAAMLVIPVIMLIMFKKRGWF